MDAEAGFTQGHADAQIEQQRGQPGAHRETNSCHREQQHQGTDQQREGEVGDGEGRQGFERS